MKLLLATNNGHKIEEFQRILADFPIEIEFLTPRDLGISIDPEETGTTLYANAEIKAIEFFRASGVPTVADDTGLEVEALGNAPGVFSARYAGEHCSPRANRKKLLAEMDNSDDRRARFKTVICYFDGDRSYFVSGKCEGEIIREEHGTLGFGYDSIFRPENYEKTFAELLSEEKNAISHRGNAVRKFGHLLLAMQKPIMKIGFLASGTGSNVEAIIEAISNGRLYAKPMMIISNNSDAKVREKAEKYGIPFKHISSKMFASDDERDQAIADEFANCGVNMVCLAGYMKQVGEPILKCFGNNVLNIHPALLPKFGGAGMYGINVHKAVIEAGETESGVTIHLANSQYDSGKILAQKKVKVLPGDLPETLQKRVLCLEHTLYAETLQKIVLGDITL